MKNKLLFLSFLFFIFNLSSALQAQNSVARKWNEVLLEAIRNDFARPTVHARNLFHTAVALYDSWAVYDNQAQTFFLGKNVGKFYCPLDDFNKMPVPAAQQESMSYAAYRLLSHRFANSPGAEGSLRSFDSLMSDMGYDKEFTSIDYSDGSPAALGNYLAQKLIEFGLQDGSNEQGGYKNRYYEPRNSPLIPVVSGTNGLQDPNHWQPMILELFIDQSGHIFPFDTTRCLSPEWGQVIPFALRQEDLTIYQRDAFDYWVYHDPGAPPYLDTLNFGGVSEEYKWSFALVSVWASHHDPNDGIMWDISPAAQGNIQKLPQTLAEYHDFYNLLEGGDSGTGHDINPYTGKAYEPQIVPRADYTRCLAEFWADGPDSETPPGHWFTILNYVSDHPLFVKRFAGVGDTLDALEWDVKAYLILGGAVHDAAIAAWGIKGWYDYVRPISAIRYMAERGQSSEPELPNYDPGGIPLIEGYIEVVLQGDSLAGSQNENVGKIKVYTWRGPEYIINPETDVAGVGWILAEDWWSYQRPSFVTPPFPGYVSGHSVFSRAAAEVMTMLTGDEYFPGGMSEFFCPKNKFLVFEDGPSMDITLQWATYRDASDQTSLSRIWGGIHPPADDIPGRKMGIDIGVSAFELAGKYFTGEISAIENSRATHTTTPSAFVYPNPALKGQVIQIRLQQSLANIDIKMFNILGQLVYARDNLSGFNTNPIKIDTSNLASGLYLLKVSGRNFKTDRKIFILR